MQDALKAVREMVRPLLMNDPMVAGVQPDYLRDGVTAYPERGGKLLRPALALWACGACGGEPTQARHVAAAIEVFHTWTLVHDDIIDCDDLRRGQPSVHALTATAAAARFDAGADVAAKFGRDMAILAGDIQQAWANRLLLRAAEDGVDPTLVLGLMARMNGEITPGLIGGEALDVEFELRPFASISTGEILAMLRGKTALLLRFAAEAGATVGCGSSTHPAVARLGDFGEHCGLAFQLRDDVLGLYGDPVLLGKPVGSDLRQGKRTLLVAAALERLQGTAKERLRDCLGKADLSEIALAAARDAIRDCGALAWVEQMAADCVAKARTALAELPASRDRELLCQWADYVCGRTR